MTPLVEFDKGGAAWILRLQRPPANALNLELVQAAHAAIVQASADSACAGIVLTGAPGMFSAGIDTREVPGYDRAKRAAMLETINRTILALYGSPKPTVAAISGHALGGALVLALACDVRFAARGPFKLGLTEALAGIPFPAGPLTVVQAELSPAQLRVLALGALAAGPDADAFAGIVDRVVDASELLGLAVEEARRLAAMPAYGRVKLQLRSAALERLSRIVANAEEPLLERWT